MNKTEAETVGGGADNILVGLAVLVGLAGIVGFSFWSELGLPVRLSILAGGVGAGLGLAWFTVPGKRCVAFAQDAWSETKRVTWPTRKETVQTTWVVFAFVTVMALFLFAVDRAIEYGLYDLLLGWKR